MTRKKLRTTYIKFRNANPTLNRVEAKAAFQRFLNEPTIQD
jgi:hypothetical protein